MPQSKKSSKITKIGRMDVSSVLLNDVFNLPENHYITNIIKHPYKNNVFIFYIEGPQMKEVKFGKIIPQMSALYQKNMNGRVEFIGFSFYDKDTEK